MPICSYALCLYVDMFCAYMSCHVLCPYVDMFCAYMFICSAVPYMYYAQGHHNDMQLYIQQREQLEKDKVAAQSRLDQLDTEVIEQMNTLCSVLMSGTK